MFSWSCVKSVCSWVTYWWTLWLLETWLSRCHDNEQELVRKLDPKLRFLPVIMLSFHLHPRHACFVFSPLASYPSHYFPSLSLHILLYFYVLTLLAPSSLPSFLSLRALSSHKWSLIASNGDELIVVWTKSIGDCFLLYTVGYSAGRRP